MFKLTRKLEYGLIALRHLQMQGNTLSSTKEISQMYMIPNSTLAKRVCIRCDSPLKKTQII